MNLLVLRLVQIAKLHSCRNSQNFWDNELILSPLWFFSVTVFYYSGSASQRDSLVPLSPTETKQKLRVASVIPFYGTILWILFCVRFTVDLWCVSNFWSQDPASSHRWVKVLCLWARYLVTTLPLINHGYKEVSQIRKGNKLKCEGGLNTAMDQHSI